MTGKNVRQFLRSVSAKMILWMIFLIFPVNLLAIGLSSATIKSAEKQVGSSIQYLLEESAEDLKVRMNNAEYYLWNLKTQDSRIIEMSRQLDNDEMNNTSIADYVWLPLRFVDPCEEYPNGMVFIDWLDEWKIEDYE